MSRPLQGGADFARYQFFKAWAVIRQLQRLLQVLRPHCRAVFQFHHHDGAGENFELIHKMFVGRGVKVQRLPPQSTGGNIGGKIATDKFAGPFFHPPARLAPHGPVERIYHRLTRQNGGVLHANGGHFGPVLAAFMLPKSPRGCACAYKRGQHNSNNHSRCLLPSWHNGYYT